MKIGVTCYPTVGGSGILGTRLGVEFAKRGHRTHFITLERPFALQDIDYDFVKVHRVSVVEYPLLHGCGKLGELVVDATDLGPPVRGAQLNGLGDADPFSISDEDRELLNAILNE